MSSHIDYQHFRRGEHCNEEGCRARKFYIEDGKKFCQRGHEQIGFTQTQQDEDDWNNQGKTSRKKRTEKTKVGAVLVGAEARELYLQCFQLILWKQSNWLVTQKGFSEGFETVVRDLWGLRLGFLHKPVQENHGNSSDNGTAMMFSSTSEGEHTDTDGSETRSLGSRRSIRSGRTVNGDEALPKLIETLGLCVLAMLLMRLPTSLGEVCKWVARDELVYNRAISSLPNLMRDKLPSHFRSAFETRAPMKGSNLHRATLGLVDFYSREFEMKFPPINHQLLLFKHIETLGLSIDVYPAVRRLTKFLNFDFTYAVHQKRNTGELSYPELQLICLVVLATKLSYPFDDLVRIPGSETDPAAVQIDWLSWCDVMTNEPMIGQGRGEEVKITEDTVLGKKETEIDAYLDWYQETWMKGQDSKISAAIRDSFPLPGPSQSVARLPSIDHGTRLKGVQHMLAPMKGATNTGEGPREPGEGYRRYRKRQDMPECAKVFFESAALATGVSIDTLLRGVYHVEGQIMDWNLSNRRRTR